VRQDKPEPFAIELIGQVGPDGAPLQVYGPEDQLILETRIPAGSHAPYTLPVPSAGAGVYTIFVQARDGKDNLMVPLTRLPEIYCPGYWSQHRQTRFFTRSAGETPEVLEIQPHATPGSVLTDDMRLLGATEKGEWIKAEVGPEGAWVIMKSRYVHVKGPVPLAIDRARWFAPPPDRLTLKPKPPAKPVAPKQETLAP